MRRRFDDVDAAMIAILIAVVALIYVLRVALQRREPEYPPLPDAAGYFPGELRGAHAARGDREFFEFVERQKAERRDGGR